MDGESAPIHTCLSGLYNDNCVIFAECCKILYNYSTSANFKIIIPGRLEEIIPLLVRRSQYKSQSYERYYAKDLMLALCRQFRGIFFYIFSPLVWRSCFLNNDVHKIESGIFLFNKLREYISENTMEHFCPIIAKLIFLLNHPRVEIQLPALVTLTNYTKHCIDLESSQFSLPFFEKLIPFIYHENMDIQKKACLAVLELHKYFEPLLSSHTHLLERAVQRAYVSNETNSTAIDEVQAMVDNYILNP